MATRAENLATAIDGYLRKLAELADAVTSAGDEAYKLTYSVNGQSFSWTEYQRFLSDQLKSLTELQASLDGGWEIRTRSVP